MGNLFYAMIFLAFSFASFRYGYAYMGAVRAFYGLFGEIAEVCVVHLSEKGEEILPYFEISKIEEEVDVYLKGRLMNVCSYEWEAKGTDFRDSYGKEPRGAEIHLHCFLAEGDLLSKTAVFALVEE